MGEKAKALHAAFRQRCQETADVLVAAGLKISRKTKEPMNDPKEFKLQIAGVKGKKRAEQKFKVNYKYNCLMLTDLLRASFVFHSLTFGNGKFTVTEAARIIHKKIGIVRCKDRFTNALENGYRDVLLNVNLNGFVCEIQIHLEPFYELKKKVQHAAYEKVRECASGKKGEGALVKMALREHPKPLTNS